jgi:hypothetical protein
MKLRSATFTVVSSCLITRVSSAGWELVGEGNGIKYFSDYDGRFSIRAPIGATQSPESEMFAELSTDPRAAITKYSQTLESPKDFLKGRFIIERGGWTPTLKLECWDWRTLEWFALGILFFSKKEVPQMPEGANAANFPVIRIH